MRHKASLRLCPRLILSGAIFARRTFSSISLYCGICHSDLHLVRNEWGRSIYPMVPGHEIVGRVIEKGKKARRLKKGDLVAIGCFVDSCRKCSNCMNGLQQYCTDGLVLTYNSYEKDGKTVTQGGYSTKIVVDEDYVLK